MPTISVNNMDTPPPKVWRRFTNAMIMFFLPMVTGIVQGVPMPDTTRNVWMIGIVAVPFLLKGIGMILGNGEVYADISQVKPTELESVVEVKKPDLSSMSPAAPGDMELNK